MVAGRRKRDIEIILDMTGIASFRGTQKLEPPKRWLSGWVWRCGSYAKAALTEGVLAREDGVLRWLQGKLLTMEDGSAWLVFLTRKNTKDVRDRP